MNRSIIRITTCALTATIAFSGLSLNTQAAGLSTGLSAGISTGLSAGLSSIMPSGGVNITLTKEDNPSLQVRNDNRDKSVEYLLNRAALEQARKDAGIVPEEPTEDDLLKSLVIAKVNDYVNVRSIPSEEGEIIGKLYNKSVGTFVSEENGWYQITSGSVTGYVKAEFCVTGEEAIALAKEVSTQIATVNTQTLKVRTEPSLEASVLGLIPMGDELIVLEEVEGWVKVDVEEGIGWVSKEFVDLSREFVQAESKEEEEKRLAKEAEERRKAREAAQAKAAQNQSQNQSQGQTASTQQAASVTVSGGSEMGNAVAEYALQFVGNPYKYGGTSLTNGADCSGFVMSVYANFGVSLPHSSSADRKQGSAVDGLANAQPGDLICYSGHVALYIGNGQIVHASTKKTGIIVSKADYKKILAIRRIF